MCGGGGGEGRGGGGVRDADLVSICGVCALPDVFFPSVFTFICVYWVFHLHSVCLRVAFYLLVASRPLFHAIEEILVEFCYIYIFSSHLLFQMLPGLA